jgi:hypothetical protein
VFSPGGYLVVANALFPGVLVRASFSRTHCGTGDDLRWSRRSRSLLSLATLAHEDPKGWNLAHCVRSGPVNRSLPFSSLADAERPDQSAPNRHGS